MGFSSSPQLLRELEYHVWMRTGRRVRDLTIELSPERVILQGRTTSYYIKQLAQHGVRELLPHIQLENVIVVDQGPGTSGYASRA